MFYGLNDRNLAKKCNWEAENSKILNVSTKHNLVSLIYKDIRIGLQKPAWVQAHETHTHTYTHYFPPMPPGVALALTT